MHGKQCWIIAKDEGKRECAANSNGWIVAEIGGKRKCAVKSDGWLRMGACVNAPPNSDGLLQRIGGCAKNRGPVQMCGKQQWMGASVNARQTASVAENRTEEMPCVTNGCSAKNDNPIEDG